MFFIPHLIHYLRTCLKGFHKCQLQRNEKLQPRQLQCKINPDYKAMTRLSLDFKVMPRLYKGHKFILVVIDEITNFMVTVPIYESRSEETGDALIDHVFSQYSIPECMIMDQDNAFMSTLINYLLKKLDIIIKTVAPYNHHALQAEHGIKSSCSAHEAYNRIRTILAKISTICNL